MEQTFKGRWGSRNFHFLLCSQNLVPILANGLQVTLRELRLLFQMWPTRAALKTCHEAVFQDFQAAPKDLQTDSDAQDLHSPWWWRRWTTKHKLNSFHPSMEQAPKISLSCESQRKTDLLPMLPNVTRRRPTQRRKRDWRNEWKDEKWKCCCPQKKRIITFLLWERE